MQCHEFERRLHAVLDEREAPEEDAILTAHAGRCLRCARLLAGQRALFFGLANRAAASQGRELSRGNIAAASSAPQRRDRITTRRAWMAAAAACGAAAAVLLVISLGWLARQNSPLEESRSLALPSAIVAKSTGSNRSRLAILQPGRRARHERARETSTFTGGDLLLEAPRLSAHYRHYCGAIDELAIALPGAVERLADVEQLAPGLRPLRVSLTIVWDTLCRALPSAKSGPPPAATRSADWTDAMRLA
jgi:hypothetical protein